MNKAVYYLAAKDNGNQEYLAGDEIEINLAINLSPQIKIDRPDKTDDFLNLDKNLQNNYISYDKTKIVGNYKVFSGSRIIDEIAVNTDPRESVTKYLSETDFNDYLKKIDFKGKHIVVAKNENPAKVILQSRFGSELWKYFILIALLLAIVEMTIARNTRKEMVSVNE
jgi:hypothetical protein